MTITEVISLINIKDIPFIPQKPGNIKKEMLPIYSSLHGVCYYEGLSIQSVGSDENSKKETYQIKQKLTHFSAKLADDERELNKYVAIFEILNAINKYKCINNNVECDIVKDYVDILNTKILNSLDFNQIPKMEILKELITHDKLYSQMLFNVYEICSTAELEFSNHRIEKRSYSFGNIKYHEELDCVSIRAYDDSVMISCMKEQRSPYTLKLDQHKEYTLEKKIISALDYWRCSFD